MKTPDPNDGSCTRAMKYRPHAAQCVMNRTNTRLRTMVTQTSEMDRLKSR
jgi:hypothetical protein